MSRAAAPGCAGRAEERLDRVAVAAVVAAHVLDVPEEAIGSLRQGGHRARDDAARHLGRNRHEQERGPRPEEIGVLDGPLGSGRQVEQQQVERAPLEGPEDLAEERELPRGAPRVRFAVRRALELERLRLRDHRAHREDPDPVAGPRQRDLVAAGHEQGPLDARHARLRRAVEVRVQDRDPKPARPQGARELQRQRALADAALAGADRHEVTHPGQPVGDAGALLRHLLEDAGPSVAGDVVVALHVVVTCRDSLGRPRRRGVEEMPAGGAETERLEAAPSRSPPGGPSGTARSARRARGAGRAAASGGLRRPRRTSGGDTISPSFR